MSYPLTKEYFLYRYVTKAILYKPNVNYAEEFNKEKEIHLNFVRYISSLKQSYFKLEKAKEQFNEEHKINSWLIEKSNSVSNHSGKIALTYSTLITGVILLRLYVFDEEEPLYELYVLYQLLFLLYYNFYYLFRALYYQVNKPKSLIIICLRN